MSRAERRAYKRMTKNQDPYAAPGGSGVRARAERQRSRRTTQQPSGPFVFVTGRFLAWALGGALAAGLIGFSIAWPNGLPLAASAGLAVALVWGLVATALRFAQRRTAALRR